MEILSNSQPPTNTDGSVLTSSPSTPIAPAGTQAPPSTLAGTTYTVTAEYTENLVDESVSPISAPRENLPVRVIPA